jgi:protein-tyrosine phosphatase
MFRGQERLIVLETLESVPNFRDLGGRAARAGRRIRSNILFRSEALHEASSECMRALGGLPLRVVCDLRSPAEQRLFPIRWSEPVPRVHAIEVQADHSNLDLDSLRTMMSEASGAAARGYYLSMYSSFARSINGLQLGAFLTAISSEEGIPALIHCTAGKDRTGFLCAVILDVLGVSWEQIVEDYMRSAALYDSERIVTVMRAYLGQDCILEPRAVKAFEVQLEYLEAAFNALQKEFGSSRTFLAKAGLADKDMERLSASLLE